MRYWHASSLDAQSRLLWAALKHELVYRIRLFLIDKAYALVAAAGACGSLASLTTKFICGDDLAAAVRSPWCRVNATTQRPRRINDHIASGFAQSQM